MSNNREMKEGIVEEIIEKIKNAKSIVLVDYNGLTVAQDTELRNNFRQNGVDYKVYKNRLLKIAFEKLGIKFDEANYENSTALAVSSDVVAPAKIVFDAEKKYNSVIKAKCGYIENVVKNYEQVKQIATIPSKEVLVAQLLGMLVNPMRSLAVAISEVAKKNA